MRTERGAGRERRARRDMAELCVCVILCRCLCAFKCLFVRIERSVFPLRAAGVSVRDPELVRGNLDYVLTAKQQLMTEENIDKR